MLLAAGDNATHHARYAEGYHERVPRARCRAGDGFLITRAGAWGEQARNTAIWPGDLDSDFSEPASTTARAGATSAACRRRSAAGSRCRSRAIRSTARDIGGFRGFPTTEALLRWAEYAAFGTIMQLGGGGKSHNPWDTTLFDPGADVIYKTYADVHMQLNPCCGRSRSRPGATARR